MKKISYVFICFTALTILSIFCLNWFKKIDVTQQLKNIPQDERKYLDLFFRSCFAFDSMGYALFGDKPIAVIGYSQPNKQAGDIDDVLDYLCIFHPENMRKRRGWEIWEKYQRLFPMKEYVFIKSKNFVDNDFVAILFINKKAFLETVREHLADFKKILGDKVTPELLLERVLNAEDVFGQVLKNHQGLIGTLLGYGRQNAWAFHEREQINPVIGKKRFFLKKIPKSPCQKELDSLNERLQMFDNRGILDFNPLLLGLPGFAADPNSPETLRLKNKYEKQYRQIIHAYQNNDFLEVTLQKLSSSNNP